MLKRGIIAMMIALITICKPEVIWCSWSLITACWIAKNFDRFSLGIDERRRRGLKTRNARSDFTLRPCHRKHVSVIKPRFKKKIENMTSISHRFHSDFTLRPCHVGNMPTRWIWKEEKRRDLNLQNRKKRGEEAGKRIFFIKLTHCFISIKLTHCFSAGKCHENVNMQSLHTQSSRL